MPWRPWWGGRRRGSACSRLSQSPNNGTVRVTCPRLRRDFVLIEQVERRASGGLIRFLREDSVLDYGALSLGRKAPQQALRRLADLLKYTVVVRGDFSPELLRPEYCLDVTELHVAGLCAPAPLLVEPVHQVPSHDSLDPQRPLACLEVLALALLESL